VSNGSEMETEIKKTNQPFLFSKGVVRPRSSEPKLEQKKEKKQRYKG
jgi:hypothetical protein